MSTLGTQRSGHNTEDSSRYQVRDINAEHQAKLSGLERMALYISEHVGTPGFFLLLVLWTTGWVLWNLYAPHPYRFDRAMEFTVWVFISNIIQLFLLPLLMVAENLQSRHDRLLANNQFESHLKTAQEIEAILGYLRQLHADMAAVKEQLNLSQVQTPTPEGANSAADDPFVRRQQEMLDAMAQKLAQTHEQALREIQPPPAGKP